jgi:CBS domain-containing protein
MQRRIVPDIIQNQDLVLMPPSATVRETSQTMATQHIGAVLVLDGGRLAGIFTERDLLTRVVAVGLAPERVTLREVMTANPDTIGPSEFGHDALALMRKRGYRHLPVVDGARIIGIVSARDIYGAMIDELEDEINDRDSFIHGRGYSVR